MSVFHISSAKIVIIKIICKNITEVFKKILMNGDLEGCYGQMGVLNLSFFLPLPSFCQTNFFWQRFIKMNPPLTVPSLIWDNFKTKNYENLRKILLLCLSYGNHMAIILDILII